MAVQRRAFESNLISFPPICVCRLFNRLTIEELRSLRIFLIARPAIKQPHHQENANHAENETLPARFYVGM